jgi:predicted DNA-binding transcriptional regulator YafY
MNNPFFFRLSQISQIIRNDNYPGVDFLAEKFEVCRRTIHRDIEFLRDSLGAPIGFSRTMKGYYYKEKTWNLPFIPFTEQELTAMMMVKFAIGGYLELPFEKHLYGAFKKISQSLPEELVSTIEDLENQISFRTQGCRTYDFNILESITKSLRRNCSIKISYYSAGNNHKTERIVDPYHFDNLRGDWYLIGYCHLRDDIRIFSVNRIQECHLLNHTFEKDPDFNYQNFIQNAFGIIRTMHPLQITVRFYNFDARLVKERIWHKSQKIEELEDGSIIINLQVSGLEEIKRWILASGSNAEVISPDWLRQQLKKELLEAAERYK